MFNSFSKFICKLLFILLVYQGISNGQNNLDEAEVTELIGKISKYEYGKDRSPLFEFNEILINSINLQKDLEFLEDKLIELLINKSTLDAKKFACQLLAKIGTSKSIDSLIDLLKNENTSDIARYALEKINNDEVDEKLLNVINSSERLIKIGIINTLGIRGSKRSVVLMSVLSLSNDKGISAAAISALGKIGGDESVSILKNLINNLNERNIPNIGDALLRIAENSLSIGELQKSANLFNIIYSDKRLASQRTAALKGLIYSSQEKSERDSIVLYALLEKEDQIQQLGLSCIPLLTKSPGGNVITENFNRFNDGMKIRALTRIGFEGIKYYSDFVKIILKKSSPKIKIAAVECLQSIGNAEDVKIFLEYSSSGENGLANVSRQALYQIKGNDVDNQIINLVNSSNSKEKVELINAIGERRILKGFSTVYSTAKNENQNVRLASYRTLGIISSFNDLEKLMKIFFEIEDSRELKSFENSLAKISLSHPKKNKRASVFLNSLQNTSDHEKKMSLLRILGATGDENAFSEIKIYLEDENDNIRKVAIQSLYNWPDITAADELFNIVKLEGDHTNKILAFRSFMNVLKENRVNNEDEVLDYYQNILPYIESNADKSLLLSGIAELGTLKALEFASTFLVEEELRAEAELAIFEIIENGGWDFPNESISVLEKIILNPSGDEASARAKFLKEEMMLEL